MVNVGKYTSPMDASWEQYLPPLPRDVVPLADATAKCLREGTTEYTLLALK